MLNMVVVQNSADFEYLYKIIRALGRADDRVAEALQRLNVIKETYEAPKEIPSRFMLELTGASSGDMRLSDHAARSMI